MKVVIVGAGVAGAAACYTLINAGADCTWIGEPGGATGSTSGAFDLVASGRDADEALPIAGTVAKQLTLSPGARSFSETVARAQISERPACLVSARGTWRSALGADACLLNLRALPRAATVGVLQLPLRGWDAPWLARGLNEFGLNHPEFDGRFVAVPGFGEAVATPFTSAYDCAEWLRSQRTALIDGLRREMAGAKRSNSQTENESRESKRSAIQAWLLPPACFTEFSHWRELRDELGCPVGETLSEVSGIAGQRWERAREAWCRTSGAKLLSGRVQTVDGSDGSLLVKYSLRGDPSRVAHAAQADAVVLALGGFSGEGLRLTPFNQVEVGCKLDAALGLGLTLERAPFSVSAERGVDVAALGVARLMQVGLAPQGSSLAGDARRIAIAGDLMAGAPRTVGWAVESGVRAATTLLAQLRLAP